uniref:Uncharacterized protein n=1 Tax=Arundo donax TaxID=35708 RepID=A0A0A8ZA82_ARUDO
MFGRRNIRMIHSVGTRTLGSHGYTQFHHVPLELHQPMPINQRP